jgi:hypothetical protein
MDADSSDYDIDDRIDCTDLVKMDFVDQFSVKTGFSFCDAMKNLKGGVFDRRSEVRVLEEGSDLSPRATVLVFMRVIMMVVMGIVIVRSFHKEASTREATTERTLRFQNHFFREVKALDGVLEDGERHAKVEEGASKHVPADS